MSTEIHYSAPTSCTPNCYYKSGNSKSTQRFSSHVSVLVCFFVDYFKRLGIVHVYILRKAFLEICVNYPTCQEFLCDQFMRTIYIFLNSKEVRATIPKATYKEFTLDYT